LETKEEKSENKEEGQAFEREAQLLSSPKVAKRKSRIKRRNHVVRR